MNKKILFLTGTRADFGKLKSLIRICNATPGFDVSIFATGMHLQEQYGYTFHEIEKSGFTNIHGFANHQAGSGMDTTMAKTIEGLSAYVQHSRPDLLVVHGDRIETLAGSIVGALNNILVAHIEGGEVSGTVDELIRHAVTKMSHLHFVSNDEAAARLVQMGELPNSIHVIGSPDMDVMASTELPSLDEVNHHYEIPFDAYGIIMFHPVTTELNQMKFASDNLFEAARQSGLNYVVVYPNNDMGSDFILESIHALNGDSRFRVFPSIRFESFLTLLRNSRFILGNSSAGIREAPFYGIPTVNVGSRQSGRSDNPNIVHCSYEIGSILKGIKDAVEANRFPSMHNFGAGSSDKRFIQTLQNKSTWNTESQKRFLDIKLSHA
ncbi:MAG: UDP-N-acetylglucosamine 2-epimerase [Bacteroidota bacterium]